MGLIFDDPQLAALTLTRVAAEEPHGPGELTGRMHTIVEDLTRRNGVGYLAELVIVLARGRFIALDDFARVTGTMSCWIRWNSRHWTASMTAARLPAGAGLPAGLVPPVKVALARAVTKMPRAGALPGTLLYEPKWDGYRAVGIRDDNGATLWSRQGKDLTRYFPELVAAIASAVPPGCVIDGEAVIWSQGRLDFSALQQRLGAGPKSLPGLVRETPASYAAFDVLAVAGHDARELPLSQRRALLEELASGWEPPLSLSPTTTDPDEAARWFEEMPHTGIEGLIIKRNDQPYAGGVRNWWKLKHRETVEVVCGAVIGPISQPSEAVAGLVLDGELRIVGRSTPLKTAAGRELARWLEPPRGTHPWPATVKGTTLDRFNRDNEPVALTLVEPVVVEVSADTAWSGQSFRHPLRLVRVRPELNPADVEIPQRLRMQ